MNQRRSYPNSGDFNLDDLFRPEPGQTQAGQQQGQQPGGRPQPGQQQGQQSYGGQQQFGRPEYLGEGGQGQGVPAQGAPWGAPAQQFAPPQSGPAEAAPETQYLPPYPTGDPQAGGYPGQAPQQGYQPAPPAFGGAEPGYAPTEAGYGQPGAGYAPTEPGYAPAPAYGPADGGRRPSGKLIIGGVVAGCAAAAVLVVVLLSDGGSAKDNPKRTTPVAATTAATGDATAAAGAMTPEAKAQAKAVSDLLGTANDSRQAVVGAVNAVQRCDKLPESQAALTDAAGKRKDLQTKLAALGTDKLGGAQPLVDQLNQAWQASATADAEYAAWAGDAQAACDAKKADNPHYKAAVAASGTATTAKKQASGLWNAIAAQAGLPTRTDGDL